MHGPGVGSDPQQEELVEKVKNLQRGDVVAKEQWIAYAELQGENIRDPSKHNAAFLHAFLTQFQSGVRLESISGANLGELVKEGQKKSKNWKSVWSQYCQLYGGGMNDPVRHDTSFLVGFIDFVAQRASMSLGTPMIGSEPPAKRMRHGDWSSDWGMSTGLTAMDMQVGPMNPTKDQLVMRVKGYQRQGEAAKEKWASFCDTHFGGVRDPNRHDAATLQQFLYFAGDVDAGMGGGMSPAISSVTPPAGMVSAVMGMGGGIGGGIGGVMGGGMAGMGIAMSGGMYGMGGGMGGMGVGIGSGMAVGMGGTGTTDSVMTALVMKVKNYQRTGDQAKECWGQFCDAQFGGVRDPNRHDVATLQRFIADYNL